MQPRELRSEDWKELRMIRLRALHESGKSFLSNYDKESAYGEDTWTEEFKRAHWWVLPDDDGSTAGLIGATEAEGRWYLEYLWIDPRKRRCGLAEKLTDHVIGHLADEKGVDDVSLWVIEGNDAAQRLYKKMGFEEEGRQSLPDGVRKEIRMTLKGVQAGRQLLF